MRQRYVKRCSAEDCPNTYAPDRWGAMAASRAGWFLQRNGDAWCPQHIPDWVAKWRARKKEDQS